MDSIPGVGHGAAAIFIAKLGTDMSVFLTDKHVSSWDRVSPGNNESAGKKRTGTTSGNKALKPVLCECGWAASNTKKDPFIGGILAMDKTDGKEKSIVKY